MVAEMPLMPPGMTAPGVLPVELPPPRAPREAVRMETQDAAPPPGEKHKLLSFQIRDVLL